MISGLNICWNRFAITSGLGSLALVLMMSILVTTGSAYAAMPLAGVGGFVIQADRIEGSKFELIPAIDNTSAANKQLDTWTVYPQSQTTMDTVKIWGMKLFKNIDVSHLGFPIVDYVKVIVESNSSNSNPVDGTGLLLNTSQIEAEDIKFDEMEMDENMKAAHPNRITPAEGAEIGIKSGAVTLTKANLNAHYMKVSSISIPGLKVSIEMYNNHNQQVKPADFGKHTATWDNQ